MPDTYTILFQLRLGAKAQEVRFMRTFNVIAFTLLMGTAGIASAQAQNADSAPAGSNVKIAAPAMQSNSYAGMWQGVLRNASGTHRVALDVAQGGPNENIAANIVTSAQSPFSVLVDTFDVQDNHMLLKMRTAGTMFEGTVNRAQTEVRGAWKQDGVSTPLTLRKIDLNSRSEKDSARGLQGQVAQAGTSNQNLESNENPSDPVRRRKQSAFSIAPPRWFWWYEWTPQIGNQERPYGLYYW